MVRDYFPYAVERYMGIFVNQYVSYSGDLLLRNVGVPLPQFLRKIFYGLADDFESPDHRILLFGVAFKLRKIRTARVFFDPRDAFRNVFEIDAVLVHKIAV